MVAVFSMLLRRTGRSIMAVLIFPIPASMPVRCSGVERLAIPYAVVEGGGGDRLQLLARGIGPPPVQADEEVFPGELRRGHGQEQFPAGESALAFLHRPDPRVQGSDQAQHPVGLPEGFEADGGGESGVRGADADPSCALALLPFLGVFFLP